MTQGKRDLVRETIPLGHIAGIRIGAHWSVLVTFGLFTLLLGQSLASELGPTVLVWVVAALGALGLLASLTLHELAHSVVAHRHGVHVERIVLWLLGGVAELRDEPEDARSELRIAVAGPLASIALAAVTGAAAVAVGAGSDADTVVRMLGWLAAMNLVLAVFNLLPAGPLDGGRILRAVIWRRTGDRLRGTTAAARGGRTVGLTLMILGALELLFGGNASGLWLLLLGWFIHAAAHTELATAVRRHQLGATRVRDVMTEYPMAVPADWSVTDLLASAAMSSEHLIFPVVNAAGEPVAMLAWADIVAVRPQARTLTRIGSLAHRLPVGARASEDELLADVTARVVLRPDYDAVTAVDGRGRLVGLVTATDLALACHRSALGLPVRRSGATTPTQIR